MSIITCKRCDREFDPERPWEVRELVTNYWGSGDNRWVCPHCTTQQERHNIRVTLVRISQPPYAFGYLAGSWH